MPLKPCYLGGMRDNDSDVKATPRYLPDTLIEANSSVKALYVWLLPQGHVSYTYRDMVAELQMSHRAVTEAYIYLRECGLLVELEEKTTRNSGVFYVIGR